jgi:hypothetical protein
MTGPVSCPATSVTNYERTVRNIAGGRKDQHIPKKTTMTGDEENLTFSKCDQSLTVLWQNCTTSSATQPYASIMVDEQVYDDESSLSKTRTHHVYEHILNTRTII